MVAEAVSAGPSIDSFNHLASQRPVVPSFSNRFGSHCNKVPNGRATGNESKIYEGGESTGSPSVNNLIKALNVLSIALREKERERERERRHNWPPPPPPSLVVLAVFARHNEQLRSVLLRS